MGFGVWGLGFGVWGLSFSFLCLGSNSHSGCTHLEQLQRNISLSEVMRVRGAHAHECGLGDAADDAAAVSVGRV